MKIAERLTFPASPDRIAALLSDPTFVADTCTATGAIRHEATVEPTQAGSGSFTARSVRHMPVESLPDSARRFIKNELVLHHEDAWEPAACDGSRQGRIHVTVVGVPVTFTGALRLAADGAGSVIDIDGDLVAGLPIVGRRLEKAAAPAVIAALRTEEQVAAQHLA